MTSTAPVVVAAARTAGDAVIRPLYEQLAVRIHERDEPYGPALYEAALADVGLPVELASAADGTEHDDEVRARHRRAALAPGDAELGVPTLHLPGPDGAPVALFGPVVNPAPKGEAAGRLWDALLVLAQPPGFSEVKRSRAAEPDPEGLAPETIREQADLSRERLG